MRLYYDDDDNSCYGCNDKNSMRYLCLNRKRSLASTARASQNLCILRVAHARYCYFLNRQHSNPSLAMTLTIKQHEMQIVLIVAMSRLSEDQPIQTTGRVKC